MTWNGDGAGVGSAPALPGATITMAATAAAARTIFGMSNSFVVCGLSVTGLLPSPCPQSAHNPVIPCHLRDAVSAAQSLLVPLTSGAEITWQVIVTVSPRG
jgi:hypothetical protein